MVIYYADGRKETLPAERVGWERLKEIVASGTQHSYVEFVFPRKSPSLVLIVNEEGHVHRLPINRDASLLYDHERSIAGDVLVVTRDEFNRFVKNQEDDEV